MKQNWENKLALLKLEVKQHENTYESLNSQLEDLRYILEKKNHFCFIKVFFCMVPNNEFIYSINAYIGTTAP